MGTLQNPGSSSGEHLGQSRGDLLVAVDMSQMATPARSPVTGQVGVVLARSIEQDVQAGHAGGNTTRIGPGVVDAVRQQPRPGVVGRDPPQLSICHPNHRWPARQSVPRRPLRQSALVRPAWSPTVMARNRVLLEVLGAPRAGCHGQRRRPRVSARARVAGR